MSALPTRAPLRVLLVEDSDDDALLIRRALRGLGGDVVSTRVETPEDLQSALAAQRWDLVISDNRMPAFNGLAALSIVRRQEPRLPFVMLSATIDAATAQKALDNGADCCLMKGDLSRLAPAISRILDISWA